MTMIYTRDGLPIMENGAVAKEQDCCCDQPGECCDTLSNCYVTYTLTLSDNTTRQGEGYLPINELLDGFTVEIAAVNCVLTIESPTEFVCPPPDCVGGACDENTPCEEPCFCVDGECAALDNTMGYSVQRVYDYGCDSCCQDPTYGYGCQLQGSSLSTEITSEIPGQSCAELLPAALGLWVTDLTVDSIACDAEDCNTFP